MVQQVGIKYNNQFIHYSRCDPIYLQSIPEENRNKSCLEDLPVHPMASLSQDHL
jgi:hypothetical protein